MIKQKTYRLLVWAVIILLATNISMAVSFLVHKQQDKDTAAQQELQAVEIPAEQQTKFFMEQLSLTQDQVGPFREINRNYNRTTNLNARRLEDLRIALVQELGKTNPNRDTLNIITEGIGNLHQDLKNATIEYYLKMNAVCDSQQKENLNRVFMSMVNKNDEKQPPQRGRRNRFGQQ